MAIVMGLVVGEEPEEMSLSEDQHEIEHLVADGADEPLGEGVGLGGADGRLQYPSALGVEHLVERGP